MSGTRIKRAAWFGLSALAIWSCLGSANESRALAARPIARWRLPPELQEISGVALTGDGRLLAHGDETGDVWELDYRHGLVVKRFSLGAQVVRGDFEGITVANGTVFLLTSKGTLYEFREGAAGAHVDYRVHATGLKNECEFEGIVFDPAINALVFVCKTVYNTQLHGALVLYRWSLRGDSAPRPTRLTIPLADVIGTNGWKGLHPSDVTIDPLTGNYVIIASKEKALISITPAGAVVSSRSLPPGHEQPEGIAITNNGILIVSDEAGQQPSAVLTLYKWPLK
jgi:uncharacterized protein YjiK